ncbi:MAG: SIMPL domain-containing protein [Saprospiraceae bacterium]|jgi:hypothetical protein|nr:SIMPL domain-containing protein [Saprospiraceae bacterium]
MKNIKILLPILGFLCLNIVSVRAQSTDRFIRIVGNSKKEYSAVKAGIAVTVSEVQPNEYRQIKYKPIEVIHQELTTALGKMGYQPSDLIKDIHWGSFQSVRAEKYRLQVSDLSKLQDLYNLSVEGVKFGELKYIFDAPGYEEEEKLALAAINDAERKAKRLAAEMHKKVGKILNIEDKSSGCCREIEDSTQPKAIKSYKINVTFELLD